jgi:hypothetical protein
MPSFFNRLLLEAEGDAPDVAEEPMDPPTDDDGGDMAPDIDDGGDFGDPLGGEGSPEGGGEDDGFGGGFGDEPPQEGQEEEITVDVKIENILKNNLYGNFLKLIDILNDMEGNFSNNNDSIFSQSPEASALLSKISKIKGQVIDYTALFFVDKPYPTSLVLYNKLKVYIQVILERFQKLMKRASKE